MSSTRQKLGNYLESNNSTATQHTFDSPVHSLEQASNLLESTPDRFVKTLCFESVDSLFVSVIVLGSSRVDATLVQKFLNCTLNCTQIKPATKESILENTGYPVGGIPPVGFDSIFIIDTTVMTKDEVFAGGGNDMTLLKITPTELLRLNKGL